MQIQQINHEISRIEPQIRKYQDEPAYKNDVSAFKPFKEQDSELQEILKPSHKKSFLETSSILETQNQELAEKYKRAFI